MISSWIRDYYARLNVLGNGSLVTGLLYELMGYK